MTAMQQAPQRCPLDMDTDNLDADLRFFYWWQRGTELVGAEAFPMLNWPNSVSTWTDLPPADRPTVMKRLNALDTPRRVLLLTMVCLAEPKWADWLSAEQGLNFGHLAACRLDTEVFQVVVGLLANYRDTLSN